MPLGSGFAGLGFYDDAALHYGEVAREGADVRIGSGAGGREFYEYGVAWIGQAGGC